MKYRAIALLIVISGISLKLNAQGNGNMPKLVLGVVADPMGYDWIDKYWDYLEDNGIRKLVKEGTSFEEASLNHFLAGTGPSHASISTELTP